MNDSDKYKAYSSMAETTRKWVSVMDTKAGFISALNAGLLGFIWTGAKLIEAGLPKVFALSATVFSLLSLFTALKVVLPRASLKHVFGKHSTYSSKQISFYGFVADYYPKEDSNRFLDEVQQIDEVSLAREALEQHFTISHIVQCKSKLVAVAGYLLQIALVLTVFSMFIKVLS